MRLRTLVCLSLVGGACALAATGFPRRIGLTASQADVSLPDRGPMDLGLAKLPSIIPYDSDRNRTAPVAFTGDKFEFRAPGASQSIALPVTMFASLWAWGVQQMTDMIEERSSGGKDPMDVALDAVKEAVRRGGDVLFEGDAYSREWHEEAKRRGLIQAVDMPGKIDLLLLPENRKTLEELGVFREHELEALHDIRLEAFVRSLEIEVAILYDMLWEGILPALSKQLILEKNSLSALDGMEFPEGEPWREYILGLGRTRAALIEDAHKLNELRGRMAELPVRERADFLVGTAIPLMDSIRKRCDAAEVNIAADIWPYPISRNLLSLSV